MRRERGSCEGGVYIHILLSHMYTREEQLEIFARVGVTKEAYELLRKEKRRSKLSMTKIVSELVIKQLINKSNEAS